MDETRFDVENNQEDDVLIEIEATSRGGLGYYFFLLLFFVLPCCFPLTSTQVSYNGFWFPPLPPHSKEKRPLHKYLAHISEIAALHT